MSRPPSYFDREQKIWTHAQMMAKLAERSHQPPEAVQSPKEKSEVKLQWATPEKGATYVKTVCGRYTCAKPSVMGQVQYELFKRQPDGSYKPLAYRLESFAEAQRLADEDLGKRA
jgi:hypothetical protein